MAQFLKYPKKWGALFGMLMMASALFAQSHWVDKGNENLRKGDFAEAITYFEWAMRKDTTADAASGMANAYYHLREMAVAERLFRAAERHGGVPQTHAKSFARCMWSLGNFADAKRWLEKAGLPNEGPSDPANIVQRLQKDSAGVDIRQITSDPKISEFSPQILPDGLLITATRNNPAVVYQNKIDARQTTSLFLLTQKDSLQWSGPRPLRFLSNVRCNEGPASCFGKEMVYCSNAGAKGSQLGLYLQFLGDSLHPKPVLLPFNEESSTAQHPAFSPDGKTLYFSSNRAGGKGGYDIWFVQRVSGRWGEPHNLTGINTDEDELFPYLSPNGLFYFASEGLAGMGGLDIYQAPLSSDGKVGGITNLGYPINSSADDFGICTTGEDREGYFSSNRNSVGLDDNIYWFRKNTPEFDCQPQEEANLCFKFTEEDELGLNMTGLPMRREWDFGDGTKVLADSARHCFAGPGSYTIRLNLVDSVLHSVYFNQTEYVLEIQQSEQPYVLCYDSVQLGKTLELDASQTYLPGLQPTSFYWNLGEGWYKGLSKEEWLADALGAHEIRLGVTVTDEEGNPMPSRCVTRTVQVVDFEPVPTQLRTVNTHSEKFENAPEPQVDIADSVADFTVQVLQSSVPIDTNELVKRGLTPVRMIYMHGVYNYLVGKEKDIQRIYPTFRKAIDEGFDKALVVAIADGKIISGNDSTLYLRLPVEGEMVSIRLIKGLVVDSQGHPLSAMVTWQDLVSGSVVDSVRSKSADGSFFVKLSDGKLYGYSVESKGFFPVSDYLDLRAKDAIPGENLVNLKPMTMYSMEEMRSDGISIRLNNVFFDTDSAILRKESYPELHRLARILAEYPDWEAEISGHTDNVGNDAYNQGLSERRAKSILKYLILNGIDVSKLTPVGYGESKPAVPNDTPENRQLNRRVEFRFLPAGG